MHPIVTGSRHPATYSNLENHPRLIRARNDKPVPKIRLDPKTGLPSVIEGQPAKQLSLADSSATEDEDEGDDRRKLLAFR